MNEEKPAFPPKVLLGKMYKKNSQKTGEEFWIGTLGLVKTILFKDNEAAKNGEDNVYRLYIMPRTEEEIAQRQAYNAAKYGTQSNAPRPQQQFTQQQVRPSGNPNDWSPF